MFRAALLALSAAPALAQHAHHAASPYAGMEGREVSSLSPEDVAELRRGGGWGLALAAELNGAPGPAHLLELADAIPLTPEQVSAVEAIHARMKADAIAEGERLIALEAELDAGFRDRTIDAAELRRLTAAIAESRGRLRFIHLATHLETPPLLTEAQIARYAELRGYAGADPCAAIPAGHDPAMWRRHNGCD